MTFGTADTAGPAHAALVEQAAAAAAGVSGVAFLRPGLADRLRSVRHRAANGNHSDSGTPAGVRMTRPDADSPWHVEIHVVALREARTVDVARAVRVTVARRLGALSPPQPAPRITVTVTGLV
ncbi:hypothetical protein OG426_27975 [Streptomyces canus]|uniref:hypothetical protein n=1 Tax=Streptomyces canus TaxID=58343 RepID=UPI0022539155|nr:hypothetical protein [Streptomyces canus]MCX4858694.1 hypothetical protein [Streptomyces canus]WSW36014.1 hypothetical protein OG426_27975 [Streptomyces canus]